MELLPVQMFTGQKAKRQVARVLFQYCHLLCKNSNNISKGIRNFLQNIKIFIDLLYTFYILLTVHRVMVLGK